MCTCHCRPSLCPCDVISHGWHHTFCNIYSHQMKSIFFLFFLIPASPEIFFFKSPPGKFCCNAEQRNKWQLMDSFRITQSPALLTVIATIIDPLTFYIIAVGNAECTCVFQMHLSLQNAHGAEKVLNVKAPFSVRTNVNGS